MKETGYEFLVTAYKRVIVLGAENADAAQKLAEEGTCGEAGDFEVDDYILDGGFDPEEGGTFDRYKASYCDGHNVKVITVP